MTIRRARLALFVACTALSLPGAAMGLSVALLGLANAPAVDWIAPAVAIGNIAAWTIYVVAGSTWIVDRRLSSRAWPVAGGIAVLSYALMGADDSAAPLSGLILLPIGLLATLPTTLLSIYLLVFHFAPAAAPGTPRGVED